MASYVEELAEDRERVQRAIESLIEAEEKRIAELRIELAEHMEVLDRFVLRTFIFRNTFGSTIDTQTAELDTQEASKPLSQALHLLEKEGRFLEAYREALSQIRDGQPLEALGTMPIGELSAEPA